jgi:hypothetical protein
VLPSIKRSTENLVEGLDPPVVPPIPKTKGKSRYTVLIYYGNILQRESDTRFSTSIFFSNYSLFFSGVVDTADKPSFANIAAKVRKKIRNGPNGKTGETDS